MRPIDADALVEYFDCDLLNECLRNERFEALDAVKMVLRKVYTMPTLTTCQKTEEKTAGGPAFNQPGGEFTPGLYVRKGMVIRGSG